MRNYSIIMLGPGGSGKTVFLASLYKKLSTQSELGFFLQVDTDQKRKRLTDTYTQIAADGRWPPGTRYDEISEWTFTCRVQKPSDLSIHDACSFTYLDYSGSRITEETDEEGGKQEFTNKLNAADALLALLDGQQLCALMKNEQRGTFWQLRDLPSMINILQQSRQPVHFVLSKWDIVEQSYTLEQIRDRLLKIDEFKNFVKLRGQAGSPVRLIPVSSVGRGFAIPQSDGSMRKTGKVPRPFQVEVPLACVLPDIVQAKLKELQKQKDQLTSPVEVKPDFNFFDSLGQMFADALRMIQDFLPLLPEKYRLPEKAMKILIKWAELSTKRKTEDAAMRTEQLRREREESLRKVADEETALRHAVNCFLAIQNNLAYLHPASELTVK